MEWQEVAGAAELGLPPWMGLGLPGAGAPIPPRALSVAALDSRTLRVQRCHRQCRSCTPSANGVGGRQVDGAERGASGIRVPAGRPQGWLGAEPDRVPAPARYLGGHKERSAAGRIEARDQALPEFAQ